MTKVTITPQQDNAIRWLCCGLTHAQTAEKVGVARETVTRWFDNEAFVDELERRRNEVWAGLSDKLRLVYSEALDVLYNLMSGDYDPGMRLKAARTVVNANRNYGQSVIVNQSQEQKLDPDRIIIYRHLSDGQEAVALPGQETVALPEPEPALPEQDTITLLESVPEPALPRPTAMVEQSEPAGPQAVKLRYAGDKTHLVRIRGERVAIRNGWESGVLTPVEAASVSSFDPDNFTVINQ